MTATNTPQNASSATSALEQAVEWYLRTSDGELSQEERTAFQQWLDLGDNAQVYAKLDDVWRQFDQVSEPVERHVLHQSLHRKPEQSAYTKALKICAIAGLCVSLWLAYQSPVGQMANADHIALTDQKTLHLDDQSTLRLAPFSAVNVRYSAGQRHIELVRGALQITVAKDKTRPLIVQTDQATAEALGTIFSVIREAEQTQVKVSESTVRVCPWPNDNTQHSCVIANQGEVAIVESEQAQVAPSQRGSINIHWQRQLLIVEDRPILEVLDILKKHHLGYLHIDRASLANTKVSGVFPLDKFHSSINTMAASLGLKVTQFTPVYTTISKQ